VEPQYRLLIDLVRSHFTGEMVDIPENADLSPLYEAAQRHKLQTFVYGYLENTPYGPEAMEAIGGIPCKMGDIGYEFPFMEGLKVRGTRGMVWIILRLYFFALLPNVIYLLCSD